MFVLLRGGCMDIVIRNCNCLDLANVKVESGRLNIKYAMNGTGKSTISRALYLNTKGKGELAELTPFKYFGTTDDNFLPSVNGAESIKSVSIFNEDFINQFVFKPDEVVVNSFEIFIKTPKYEQQMADIEKAFSEIKDTFRANKELEQVVTDLHELSDCFGRSKSGYSEAGALHKGVGNGNKIENVPERLESYKPFLQSESNVKWLRWQIGGSEFLNISTKCPYCTLPVEENKSKILAVTEEYDAKSIEHLNKILSVLERLNKYFSDDVNVQLQKITKNKVAISLEEIDYLKTLKSNVDTFKQKLMDLKGMSFYSFKDVTEVVLKIEDLKIKMEYLPSLNSDESQRIASNINKSLDVVLAKAGALQGAINIQKLNIKKTIEDNKKEINTFLKYAGYKYLVDIEEDGEIYKMKLKHEDFAGVVESGMQHLSFGEKNAFSLVLFMYQIISTPVDLIVLDDPVSSFDRNKKYAILDTLFCRVKSFKGKTVLLMTHDLEPVVDMIHNFPDRFQKPLAFFLSSKNGVLSETLITRNDIVTFSKICMEQIGSSCDDVIKLIYLRRYFEVIDDRGGAYQLLSNLFHKRQKPEWRESGEDARVMTESEKLEASQKIKEFILDFDYEQLVCKVNDEDFMISLYKSAGNSYEKLQIFRVIKDGIDLHESDVVTKYVNEAFHIENEYLMQLSPSKYETTPKFIIDECDKSLLV